MNTKMETKQVYDLFFADKDYDTARKVRPQVDRPEVYAYEEELGKQIFEMNVDELTEMLLKFNNERTYGKNTFAISFGTVDQIASTFRGIWNYYIDNIEVIRNPWNDKRMKGVALAERLSATKEPFTRAALDKAIAEVRSDYPQGNYNANYIECLLLMFYDGFSEAAEIAQLQEQQIHFETREIDLPGRTIRLSDRCWELLQYVHDLDEIEAERARYKAVSWRGGYFKFIVRPKDCEAFQRKDLTTVGAILTRKITMNVRKRHEIDINYRLIYLLGLYDYIVAEAGEEHTKALILSVRDSADAQELMAYAKEYGFAADNVTYVKKCLRPFI